MGIPGEALKSRDLESHIISWEIHVKIKLSILMIDFCFEHDSQMVQYRGYVFVSQNIKKVCNKTQDISSKTFFFSCTILCIQFCWLWHPSDPLTTALEGVHYLTRALMGPSSDPAEAIVGSWAPGFLVPGWVCPGMYGESGGLILMQFFSLITAMV